MITTNIFLCWYEFFLLSLIGGFSSTGSHRGSDWSVLSPSLGLDFQGFPWVGWSKVLLAVQWSGDQDYQGFFLVGWFGWSRWSGWSRVLWRWIVVEKWVFHFHLVSLKRNRWLRKITLYDGRQLLSQVGEIDYQKLVLFLDAVNRCYHVCHECVGNSWWRLLSQVGE